MVFATRNLTNNISKQRLDDPRETLVLDEVVTELAALSTSPRVQDSMSRQRCRVVAAGANLSG
jgi:hypothetical protein